MLKLKDVKPKVIGLGHIHVAIETEEAGIVSRPFGDSLCPKDGSGQLGQRVGPRGYPNEDI